MPRKIIWMAVLACALCGRAEAQELQAKVSVIAQRVTSNTDRKVFLTLQQQLNNLLNNRRWTADNFQPAERINCSFILNIESTDDANMYRGTLTVQVARPVYNSSYQAALVNFVDPDISFKYQEFQPVEFNENRIQGTDATAANIAALFAYYAYMIVALDYDSFSPKGGEAYFRKAQNIITNAPEGKGISGWRVFDGLRNRYWLNENMINTRYNLIHDIYYTYYRNGLDKLYDKEAEARAGVLQALTQLQAFTKENANTMIAEFFMQGKYQEIVGIFKKGTAEQKARAVEVLGTLDIVNASRYKQELR
ncbi:type IX secretion system protein PorD [Sediminibacterium soli]|uniref:type IX secretion system protein PorD n=1 Tax=Sediminibacterium soli TaxID=2698829 RepID=UPI00137B629C|nr:DUF4835 family protein [Sediminibacterium soli]NCI45720.1 DUF4835 family protein [Sediminibacterium soli]